MAKVIECLQDGKNGVLESPTGTGKTLSLLCSSLAWLIVKKAQIQSQALSMGALDQLSGGSDFAEQFSKNLDKGGGKALVQTQNTFGWSMPKIIYASRTHSQLSQAMQELKRSAYKHVNVTVLGSRDQLCIHPEVAKETNSATKIHMCQAKIKARTCYYYNNVEARKDDPTIRQNILDIEDLVKTGQKLKCCPYYLTRELKQSADIIFMPYNYILDPKTRKNQSIEIQNNVVLLDEAHNVEKICEEATSLQISSTDIAVCIDEITAVMKDMIDETNEQNDFETPNAVQKDFTAEDLCNLKAMFLEVEKAIDAIVITRTDEGETFSGGYIFDLLEKADISHGKSQLICDKLDKIILYLTTVNTSSFIRKGNALQKFCDLLRVVFVGANSQNYRERVKRCYKVYIQVEQPKKSSKNVWETKKITKSDGKLISYWCFSPGFGMQQILDQGVRSVVLTSGTLSPLKPFISEIGIDIAVQLENPHIVTEKQICVGIISAGHDGYTLNSSYNTRNDPKYIGSLGETIKILSSILPHGLLIFFPSYPIMRTCQEEWQKTGKWTQIENKKPIFVEPQSKDGFNSIINEYYNKINDPHHKGAIFMAVCRGKVSEGLDFANANGRAVIITGLPFPPLKDPRVILKQRYLEENKALGKISLTGQQWYQLEASRAVNQAIGRIIRHKNDYGAILLCDCRFDNPSFKQQLSAWIRPRIKKFPNFKTVIKDLQIFFKYAQTNLPQPSGSTIDISDLSLPAVPAQFDTSGVRRRQMNAKVNETASQNENGNFDISSYYRCESHQCVEKSISQNNSFASLLEAKPKPIINFSICKPPKTISSVLLDVASSNEPSIKRRKLKIKPVNFHSDESAIPSTSTLTNTHELFGHNNSGQAVNSVIPKKEQAAQYVKEVKKSLSKETFKTFKTIVSEYQTGDSNVTKLLIKLEKIFIENHKLKHLLIGFKTFLKPDHLEPFDEHVKLMQDSNIW
ncbi:regulator of telomere elongation helicase 1 homolog isoform X2 [Phymastichus coffea]|nr:regulator of telomere elongation helicase 1 homolog isoform X2 [Phymastichus coffea]